MPTKVPLAASALDRATTLTNNLIRGTELHLTTAKRKMREDDRFRELYRSARLTARRALFHTNRTLSIVPRQLQSARKAAQRVTTAAVRKTPLQVSDDYIHGALDLLTVTAILALSTTAIRASTRRYQTAADIPARLVRNQRVLHGSVVAVRDGDNLRIRHTPLLYRFFGWYMPPKGRGIADNTINVRLSAVDAPECGKFGNPGQKYGPAARSWLKRYEGRKVMVRLHATDQYKRVVGTVWAKSDIPLLGGLGFMRRNVGLELVKAGYATVYTGAGAAYGGIRHVYEKAEAVARRKRIGMWSSGVVESPAEYKRAIRNGLLNKNDRTKGKPTKVSEKKTGPRALLKAFAGMYEYLTRFR